MQDKYIEPQITEYIFHKATVEHRPISGTFELSPICNYNCRMCYVHQSEEKLRKQGKKVKPPKFWLDLAKQAKKEGMLYLLLTGGEPFLYDGFWELYSELVKMGFVISINSNGSLINERVVEKLKENPPMRINITLYGASDATYEKMCGVKNGYTKTIRGIKLLKEAGIQVKLNCSLTPSNMMDLEEMLQFADENQLILEVATYMFPPVRLDEHKKGINHRFSAEEMAIYDMKIALYQRGAEYMEKYVRSMKDEKAKPGNINQCQEKEGSQILCRAGRGIFWVTWEGEITPCGMMPIPSIPLQENSFAEAWEKLTEETVKIRLAAECKNCSNKEICHVCAGMTYGENLDFTKKPEYLCDYVNALRKKCEDYEKIFKEGKKCKKELEVC